MTDEELQAAGEPSAWAAHFDDATHAALRLADAINVGGHDIADDLVQALRAHFAEEQLAELLLVCGEAQFNNRVGNTAKVVLTGGRPAV